MSRSSPAWTPLVEFLEPALGLLRATPSDQNAGNTVATHRRRDPLLVVAVYALGCEEIFVVDTATAAWPRSTRRWRVACAARVTAEAIAALRPSLREWVGTFHDPRQRPRGPRSSRPARCCRTTCGPLLMFDPPAAVSTCCARRPPPPAPDAGGRLRRADGVQVTDIAPRGSRSSSASVSRILDFPPLTSEEATPERWFSPSKTKKSYLSCRNTSSGGCGHLF